MYKMNFEGLDGLTSGQISKLINKHKMNEIRYEKLANYYGVKHAGIESIVSQRNAEDSSKPNHKIVTNYPKYIVDIASNYLVGNPVTYKSINDVLLKLVTHVFDKNYEQDHNSEIAKLSGIYGIAYELLYLGKDGEIYFSPMDPRNTMVIESLDVDPIVNLAIRYFTTTNLIDDSVTYNAELYWKDRIEYWSGNDYNSMKLYYVESHEFNEVPVVIYRNNDDEIGDFEEQITLIDDLELRLSDRSNQGDYFNNSILLMSLDENAIEPEYDAEGKQIPTSVILKRMSKARVLNLPQGSDAKFISPNYDVDADEKHIKELKESIHRFSGVPDLTDSNFAGTQSGEAMKYKLLGLEQLTRKKERKFKKGLYQRIELICNILNLKGVDANPTDVEITFTRALPINMLENAQAIKTYAETGLFSNDTLLANTTIVTDIEKEKSMVPKVTPEA